VPELDVKKSFCFGADLMANVTHSSLGAHFSLSSEVLDIDKWKRQDVRPRGLVV